MGKLTAFELSEYRNSAVYCTLWVQTNRKDRKMSWKSSQVWEPLESNGVAQLFWCVWEQVVVDGTETVLLSSFSMQAFKKSSQYLSASLKSILSQYHRLSELAGNWDTFQSKLVSIQVRKPRPGALNQEKDLESRLCGFIPANSVLSFLLLASLNVLHTWTVFSFFL